MSARTALSRLSASRAALARPLTRRTHGLGQRRRMSTGPQAGASSPLDVDTTKRSSEATTSGATPSVGEMPLGEIVRKTIDVRALLY